MAYKPVNALLRGLRVLEAVNANGPVGLTAVQRATGLPKATALRLLETLRSVGYLDYETGAQTYQVSLRALALSNKFNKDDHLLRAAAPVMEHLREQLGWPSDLAVFQFDKMVIVDTNRQPGMLSANRTIGSRVPMLASATGRAYLSYTTDEQRQLILSRLRGSTDPYEKVACEPKEVERIIRETRRCGYAISDREYLPKNRGAAVSVLIPGSGIACVINMIAVANVVTVEDIHKRYAPLLLEAKNALEPRLTQGMAP